MDSNDPTEEASDPSDPEVGSGSIAGAVVDTVVLQYFLLTDEIELLADLLGHPLYVPLIVLDVDEGPDTPPEAQSELARAMAYEDRKSKDPSAEPADQALAAERRDHLASARGLVVDGVIEIIEMTDAEARRAAALLDPTRASEFGLVFPLDPGEAACLAIAIERGWVLATDDSDALKALDTVASGHAYERIRRLLHRAADEGLISPERANELHRQMQALGFWDRTLPFPDIDGA